MTLLHVANLVKEYPTKRSAIGRLLETVCAVNDVSFTVEAGKTLAIVGESGAGKSTVARIVMGLLQATSGSVKLDGRELVGLDKRELREVRRDVQMVFQDPYSSLDPLIEIRDSVAEPLLLHTSLDRHARRQRAADLLEQVGIDRHMACRRPHELSGGQLQRVSIARALSVEPRLLVCDEPVAALDVSIRAQVINLLMDLQAERGLSYLFISHDLSLVRHIADDVAIMKGGSIVELGSVAQVFEEPAHPYTKELFGSARHSISIVDTEFETDIADL